MTDYREHFKFCGQDVRIDPDVYIEHPEKMAVGDHVHFMRGFHMIEGAEECRIGSHVRFYPNCFIQGTAPRFIVEDYVDFFPGTYISLGGAGSSVEIGHHSHFAPNCVLYGGGGLKISPYCNVAAHTVFATVGHDPEITNVPMAGTVKTGPITLEEDVWIAANVTITANTRIARGCVIGANSVVTKDTEPMGIYVGVPARRLRDR